MPACHGWHPLAIRYPWTAQMRFIVFYSEWVWLGDQRVEEHLSCGGQLVRSRSHYTTRLKGANRAPRRCDAPSANMS